MAVIVRTNRPQELLWGFIQRISHDIIKTWVIDEDGDITISRPQWRCKAWFHIYPEEDGVCFGIISSKRFEMTKELYAVYHGRLAASLLAHFDDIIQGVEISSGYVRGYDSAPFV